MPDIATDSAAAAGGHSFRASLAAKAYEEAGIGPEDLSLAEVYDLAASMELDWYEYIGLCRTGEAEGAAAQRRDAPGRAHPGQCQRRPGLLWRGGAGAGAGAGVRAGVAAARARPAPARCTDARVGITANQGLFGHGSAVLVKR